MDFDYVDIAPEIAEEAARWVAEHVDPQWVEEQRVSGTYQTAELHTLLAEHGWLGAGWPEQYGGSDRDPQITRAIFARLEQLGLREDAWLGTELVLNVILEIGTEQQKQFFIRGGLRGEVVIAIGFTEPDSGSDVAAAATRAERLGDGWSIDGQKMFTTCAEICTHIFLLTRTNRDVKKHQGLTIFVAPMNADGIEIQPIWTLGGQRTNSTFYHDIRVPDRDRIGEVDGGWAVMGVALAHERRVGRVSPALTNLVRHVAAWAKETERAEGGRVYDDPTVKERLARALMYREASKLLALRLSTSAESGRNLLVDAATAKLFDTESAQLTNSDLLDVLGAESMLSLGAGGSPLDAAVEQSFRSGVLGTLAGGASEVLREIVAEQMLGLPRTRGA